MTVTPADWGWADHRHGDAEHDREQQGVGAISVTSQRRVELGGKNRSAARRPSLPERQGDWSDPLLQQESPP